MNSNNLSAVLHSDELIEEIIGKFLICKVIGNFLVLCFEHRDKGKQQMRLTRTIRSPCEHRERTQSVYHIASLFQNGDKRIVGKIILPINLALFDESFGYLRKVFWIYLEVFLI